MGQIKDQIELTRLNRTKAGKLILELIEKQLLSEEDLNNPDIIDLINKAEAWSLRNLNRGDEIFIVDSENPRQMVRAKVIYSGMFQTLGYNDKTLVTVQGISAFARQSFPRNKFVKGLERILPRQIDLVELAPTEHVFRLINEETEYSDTPQLVLES